MWPRRTLACVTGLLVLVALVLLGGASASRTADTGTVNWQTFGNTVDENRYSPLTQIKPDNVSQLGRVFTFDLNRIVPGIKKGQQSFPIVVDGTIYVTSADDQVFAVNGVTGAPLWHYAPDNVATFKNYGIVANRGLAYCDGKLFLLTLDMTIVALNPATGDQIARVPIGRAVPGAYSNYGYSETSAPICANHTVVIGAAGSDCSALVLVSRVRTFIHLSTINHQLSTRSTLTPRSAPARGIFPTPLSASPLRARSSCHWPWSQWC